MLFQWIASTLSSKLCLFRSTATSSLRELMVNFLLYNSLMRWFWPILLLVPALPSAFRPLKGQHSLLTLLSLTSTPSPSVSPAHALPASSGISKALPLIILSHVLPPTTITSNPLVSVFTSIRGSITCIIIMASNIYWEFTIMCQALC